jgi:hypothetical protein
MQRPDAPRTPERPGTLPDPRRIPDRLHPDGPPAPRDPNWADNALHPDGPPAPRDPNWADNALHPDGPPARPAEAAPHDPNRIENALHPDGPPTPRDPNWADNALHPDGPPKAHDPNWLENRLNPKPGTPPHSGGHPDTPPNPGGGHPGTPPHAGGGHPGTPRDGGGQPGNPQHAGGHTDTPPHAGGGQPGNPPHTGGPSHGGDHPGTPSRHDSGQPHSQPPGNDSWGSSPDGAPSGEGERLPSLGNDAFPAGAPEHHEFVEFVQDAEAVDAYREIRAMTTDVPKIADQMGIDPGIVDVAKQNVFVRTHDVTVRPEVIKHGNFTPSKEYADLWKKAASGSRLDPTDRNLLRSFIAHEYVEAKLMEGGMPYRSAHRGAFDADGNFKFSRQFAGAHDTAPMSWRPSDATDLLKHWGTLRLTPPPGGLAADLSNLDDIVRIAREGLG